MTFTIYYPLTITLIVIILNSILVYSIIKLNGTSFPNISNNNCDIIPKCLIGIFVATGVFIFSLLPNCGFCSDNSNKIIRFISPILYYGSYIATTVEIYLNIDCISTYKNSTDINETTFISILGWNIISFSTVIHLMLLSFIMSQCCNYCNKKKMNTNLPINNEPLIILD
jgi:hypothetical protein